MPRGKAGTEYTCCGSDSNSVSSDCHEAFEDSVAFERHAVGSGHKVAFVRTLWPDRRPPAQAEAQDRAARVAFIEVLLRFRERLIREGKITDEDKS